MADSLRPLRIGALLIGALAIAGGLGWLLLDEEARPARRSASAAIEVASPAPARRRASPPPAVVPTPAAPPARSRAGGGLEPARGAIPAAPTRGLAFGVSGRVLARELALGPIQIEAVSVSPEERLEAACLLEGRRFELALPRGGLWRVRATSSQASSAWSLVSAEPQATQDLVLVDRVGIEGRCLGPAGEPLSGVDVTLRDLGGATQRLSSDALGRFSARVLPGEELLIHGAKEGFASAILRLDPTELAGDLRLDLEALHKVVVGRFIGPEGAPLQGSLSFDPRAPDPHAHASERATFEAELDDQGRPLLSGLPGGVWLVSLAEPAADELRAWVREIDTAEEQTPVLEVAAAARGRLAGRILSGPQDPDEVQVELRPDSLRGGFRFMAARRPEAAGLFEFPAVPPGVYFVRATWPGGSTRAVRVEVAAGSRAWAELPASLQLGAPSATR